MSTVKQKRESVLIIDDDEIDRLDVQRMLSPRFHVIQAIDGESAWQVLEVEHPDCVLLDYRIPGTDTMQLLNELVQQQVPVVMLTGQGTESTAVSALKNGADDYLVKDQLSLEAVTQSIELAIASIAARKRREEGRVKIRQRLMQEMRTNRALDNELELAAEIQQNLVPDSDPSVPGVEAAGITIPASATSGDFFDYLNLRNGSMAVVFGDASGHGLGPALIAVKTRAYIRALARAGWSANEIISVTNDLLAEDLLGGRFITLVFVRFDNNSWEIEYCCAGHDAYLIHALGPATKLASSIAPLGLRRHKPMDSLPRIPIKGGDFLLLASDGLLESRNSSGDEFGFNRAVQTVRKNDQRSVAEIVEDLRTEVLEFSGGDQRDDISAVLLRFAGK